MLCKCALTSTTRKTTFQEGASPFRKRKIGCLAYTRFQIVFNDLARSGYV